MQTVSILGQAPETDVLNRILVPKAYNYIGLFLTFRCPFHCSYCINRFHGQVVGRYPELSGRAWLRFIERLDTGDVPVTLQGGEPGLHPDFIELVREASCDGRHLDILTNLAFDLEAFARRIDPGSLNRDAPYAPIRVSYHPEQFTLAEIMDKVLFLMREGFRVGLYGVLHPAQAELIEEAARICDAAGIDFRTKPFLGRHQGLLHGRFAYPEACDGGTLRLCECAPSELLVAPDGSIHRCHHFLYSRLRPLARHDDSHIELTTDYLSCDRFGCCNPCDVKVKNNRFQQFGHVSARIRNIHAKPEQ